MKKTLGRPSKLTTISFLLSFLFIWTACEEKDEHIYPTESPLTESVYASASLVPQEEYQLFSAVSGILERVFVEEGQLVKRGDTLFQITNSNPELNARNARLALEKAEEDLYGAASPLKNLEQQIESAELRFENDSSLYFKQKKLWEQGIGAEVEYTNRQNAFEQSRNALTQAKNQLANTRRSLRLNLEQARNNLSSALNNQRDFTVTSKQDGKVYQINKEAGELVVPQEPLGVMGAADEFLIEMQVDEVDIVRLQTGLKTLITLDAYKGQVFEAEVVKIYPQKNIRTQTFSVDATFTALPEQLYSGLSGEANIIIRKKENALSIPKTYLIQGSKVLTDSGEVTVETGLESLDRIEVLGGLDAETAIYKPESAK